MGFKFQKRIKLGGGLGLNINNSGVSPSLKQVKGLSAPKNYLLKQKYLDWIIKIILIKAKIVVACYYLHSQEQ